MRRISLIVLLSLLASCGTPEIVATPIPSLAPILGAGSGGLPLAPSGPSARTPTQRVPASATPPAPGSPTLPATAEGETGSQLERYRDWIAEARVKHPYPETAAVMWAVMLCESSGDAEVEGPGGLTGLFQFTPTTWGGDWNPYRDQPITDARAQIFAVAKAWSDGNQQWWQVCLPA